jgi:hypothetical protein
MSAQALVRTLYSNGSLSALSAADMSVLSIEEQSYVSTWGAPGFIDLQEPFPQCLALRFFNIDQGRIFNSFSSRLLVEQLPQPYLVERVAEKEVVAPLKTNPAEQSADQAAVSGEAARKSEPLFHSSLHAEVFPIDDFQAQFMFDSEHVRVERSSYRKIQVLHFNLPSSIRSHANTPSPSPMPVPDGIETCDMEVEECVSYDIVHASPRVHGTPLLFCIGDGDTVGTVRERLRHRLGVPIVEFKKWRLALLVFGQDLSDLESKETRDLTPQSNSRWTVVYLDHASHSRVLDHVVFRREEETRHRNGSVVFGMHATALGLDHADSELQQFVHVSRNTQYTSLRSSHGITIR